MTESWRIFRNYFLICFIFWALLGAVGAVYDMVANHDYTTNLAHNLSRFGFYYSWVLTIWWLIILAGSLLPALTFTAFRISYCRWRYRS